MPPHTVFGCLGEYTIPMDPTRRYHTPLSTQIHSFFQARGMISAAMTEAGGKLVVADMKENPVILGIYFNISKFER